MATTESLSDIHDCKCAANSLPIVIIHLWGFVGVQTCSSDIQTSVGRRPIKRHQSLVLTLTDCQTMTSLRMIAELLLLSKGCSYISFDVVIYINQIPSSTPFAPSFSFLPPDRQTAWLQHSLTSLFSEQLLLMTLIAQPSSIPNRTGASHMASCLKMLKIQKSDCIIS